MRLTPFSKRALVGVATGGMLAAGLLVHVADAADYACPTFTDPAGDVSGPQQEKDVDLTAVTYTVVAERFQTILKLNALSATGPQFGLGDIYRTTFTVAEKAASFVVQRDTKPAEKFTTTATIGGKPVVATAVFDTKASTVTLSASVADLETAAGVSLVGQALSAMKASTQTVSPLGDQTTFSDSAAAPVDASYVFGDVCAAPVPTDSPTDAPTDAPTDDPTATATDTPSSTPGVGGFVALPEPVRVLDTRPGAGQVGTVTGPTTGDVPIDLSSQITGSATAAVLNVTSVGSSAAGFLVVHRSGTADPHTSSLNWARGAIQANEVTAALDETKGLVATIHSGGRTHVVVDLVGYVTTDPTVAAAGTLQPRTPKRLFDQTIGEGGTRITVPAADRPAGSTGVLVNVTLVKPFTSAFLSVYPGDQERPNASTVNATHTQIQANETLVALDSNGSFIVDLSLGSSRVVVDLLGSYGVQTPTSGTISPLESPVRLLDTRSGTGGPAGKRSGGSVTALTVPSSMPSGTVGVVLEVTTTQATEGGYVIVHPGGTSRPGSSTLNLTSRGDRAHQVVVALGSTGKPLVSVVGNGTSTHLVVDLVGYVVIPSTATPAPTDDPSATPTDDPSATPTDDPSATPTDDPSATPTDDPSATPTDSASSAP